MAEQILDRRVLAQMKSEAVAAALAEGRLDLMLTQGVDASRAALLTEAQRATALARATPDDLLRWDADGTLALLTGKEPESKPGADQGTPAVRPPMRHARGCTARRQWRSRRHSPRATSTRSFAASSSTYLDPLANLARR